MSAFKVQRSAVAKTAAGSYGSFAGTHERALTGPGSSDGTVAVLATSADMCRCFASSELP